MSRSYRKSPCITDRPHGAKYWKNLANRKVRRYKGYLPKGKGYRKFYDSWEIHDYISYWPINEAIQDYNTRVYYDWRVYCFKPLYEEYKTEADFINRHYKPIMYWK